MTEYRINENYACGHSISTTTLCKKEYEECNSKSNLGQFSLDSKESIFARVRRRSSITRSEQLPTRFKEIYVICQTCRDKEEAAKIQKGLTLPVPYDLVDIEAQKILGANRMLEAGKSQFQCSKCKADGRALASQAERAANDGLCCDGGRVEWQMAKRISSQHISSRSSPSTKSRSQSGGSITFSPQVSLISSINTTHEEASTTSGLHDWINDERVVGLSKITYENGHTHRNDRDRRNSEDFDGRSRSLIQEFRNVPASQNPLHGLERTAEGYYEDPCIDLDRWYSQPITRHGRIPGHTRARPPFRPGRGDDEESILARKVAFPEPKQSIDARLSVSRQESPATSKQSSNVVDTNKPLPNTPPEKEAHEHEAAKIAREELEQADLQRSEARQLSTNPVTFPGPVNSTTILPVDTSAPSALIYHSPIDSPYVPFSTPLRTKQKHHLSTTWHPPPRKPMPGFPLPKPIEVFPKLRTVKGKSWETKEDLAIKAPPADDTQLPRNSSLQRKEYRHRPSIHTSHEEINRTPKLPTSQIHDRMSPINVMQVGEWYFRDAPNPPDVGPANVTTVGPMDDADNSRHRMGGLARSSKERNGHSLAASASANRERPTGSDEIVVTQERRARR